MLTSLHRWILILAAVSTLLTGCSDDSWIADVRSAQQSAEQAATDGNIQVAMERLGPVANGDLSGTARPSDARVIRQDAYYQMARWALESDSEAQALRLADEGLELGGNDIFRANLWVVRGQAHEALGEATRAAADYHEALLINETVLDEVLAGAE